MSMANDKEGRVCLGCREFKVWGDFSANKLGINGRYSQCKPCKNALNRVKEGQRRLLKPKETYEQRREKLLKYTYGLTQSEFDKILSSQGGVCAICYKKENSVSSHFFVDHCHSSGKIRGLLCYHCNTLLGMSFDNIDTLKAAIKYLEREYG